MTLETVEGKPIDTRKTYTDFIVGGTEKNMHTSNPKVKTGPMVVNEQIDKFLSDILTCLETTAIAVPDSLEYGVCGFCSGGQTLTWDKEYGQWECPYHGTILADYVVWRMYSPFLT